MSIIGFIRMMKSHSGKRMGQALFKICKRVGIEKKVSSICIDPIVTQRASDHHVACTTQVGHVTSDNAQNNTSMMLELGFQLKRIGYSYDHVKMRMRYVTSSHGSLSGY
jgi:hypothetical protein